MDLPCKNEKHQNFITGQLIYKNKQKSKMNHDH